MKGIVLMMAITVSAASGAPALATSCDTRCDKGEVWTEAEGGTCVPQEPQTS